MSKKNNYKPQHGKDDCDDGLAAAVSADVDLDANANLNLFDCGKLVDADIGLCVDADLDVSIG
jgi:hypothetical protein